MGKKSIGCDDSCSFLPDKTEIIKNLPKSGTILFISHEASRTGAPIALLKLMRWLKGSIPNRFRIILRSGGPLEEEFRELGEVHIIGDAGLNDCYLQDVGLIYSNTITNSTFLQTLPYGEIPILTHVHELDYSIERLGAENFRQIREHTNHFIACSSSVARVLQAYNIPVKKITVIPESICPSDVQNAMKFKKPALLRKALGIGTDKFVVVGCGVADMRKGADLFVQLAAYCSRRSSKVRFLWVGPVHDDFAGAFFQYDARKLGISNNIIFTGKTDDPYSYISIADVLCLPSREDPLPLVVLEAGALGKPVLAFKKSGGTEEYCRQGGGFTVPYLDVCAMGDWILRHHKKTTSLAQAGEKARSLVERKYSINANGPAFKNVISRFLRPGARRAEGLIQIFFPDKNGYAEGKSIVRAVNSHKWSRVKVEFQCKPCQDDWIIRIDPLNRSAVIDIARIEIRSGKGQSTLWKASNTAAFDQIRVEGSALRIADPRVFKLLSLGPDPILYLPSLRVPSEIQEVQVEILLRVDTGMERIVQHSRALIDHHREREYIVVKRYLSLIQELSIPEGRKKLVWGSGAAARQFAEIAIRQGLGLSGFVDRDSQKEGQNMMSLPILGISAVALNGNSRPFVIICSQEHKQIGEQLVRVGFLPGKDFVCSPFVQ